jgi:hypothetical protein
VELEFADGSVKRLVGPPADAWMEDLNNVTAFHHIRTGNSAMSRDYQWEEVPGPREQFKHYEGTD